MWPENQNVMVCDVLPGLEERLLRQQSDCEQERSRLHGLIAKMESHVREQTRQIEQVLG